jgi:hypothetical protein
VSSRRIDPAAGSRCFDAYADVKLFVIASSLSVFTIPIERAFLHEGNTHGFVKRHVHGLERHDTSEAMAPAAS